MFWGSVSRCDRGGLFSSQSSREVLGLDVIRIPDAGGAAGLACPFSGFALPILASSASRDDWFPVGLASSGAETRSTPLTGPRRTTLRELSSIDYSP
jgi:hypothetical protein